MYQTLTSTKGEVVTAHTPELALLGAMVAEEADRQEAAQYATAALVMEVLGADLIAVPEEDDLDLWAADLSEIPVSLN